MSTCTATWLPPPPSHQAMKMQDTHILLSPQTTYLHQYYPQFLVFTLLMSFVSTFLSLHFVSVPIIILVDVVRAPIDLPSHCVIWHAKREGNGTKNKWRKGGGQVKNKRNPIDRNHMISRSRRISGLEVKQGSWRYDERKGGFDVRYSTAIFTRTAEETKGEMWCPGCGLSVKCFKLFSVSEEHYITLALLFAWFLSF